MLRTIDILLALIGLVCALPVFLVLLLLGFLDTGSPLFFQTRVGQSKRPFTLIKFRTMSVGTKSVASHLADASSVTAYGAFLRKTKLDELPQLWNVLLGNMSFVGPRPNLFNQEELIREREKHKVYSVRPGITGLSQINKIDMSSPEKLAESDAQMIATMNLKNYIVYLFKTFSAQKLNWDALENRMKQQ